MCSCAERYRRDDGRNPVNVFICGERETEEADRDEHSTDLAHHEAELGWRITMLLSEAPVASTKGHRKPNEQVGNRSIDLLVPIRCRGKPDEEAHTNAEEC